MDIIEEVVKDISEEKHYNIFKKALPIVLIVTLILVIGVSVKGWIDDKKVKHNIEMGDLLNNAVILAISGNDAAASESFEYILKEAKNNIKDLAALSKITQLLKNNKNDAMVEISKVVEKKDFQKLTKDYLRLLWLTLAIDLPQEKIDTSKMEAYIKNFQDEKKIFFGTANLINALWLIKQNREKEAEEILVKIIKSDYVNNFNKNNAQAVLSNLHTKKYSN